ncbi:unnamed protein product, partial [Closterium sp. NIES-53]
ITLSAAALPALTTPGVLSLVTTSSALSGRKLLQSGDAIFDLDYDVIISAMYVLSFSAGGDCYRCVPPDPGIVAGALGASASGTPPGTAPAEALHTFTLADHSGDLVVARCSTILPCPAVPSGSLSGLHLPSFSTNLNRHQDGGARRNQKNGANMVADSSDNNPKSNGGAEKKKERTAGQFFHIGEQGDQGDATAKVGAELHPLDYWVLDTGAAWTMTPRKELLDDVRAAPINEVCSASGHVLKVAGAGRAAFKGADGKPVVLHDVLLVPDLKANLISLHKFAKAGVSNSTDGARMYKGQLGNRMLWDLHESKNVYRSMWQLPALAWHGEGQAGEGSASQGECNAVEGVGVKVSARSGETDWATAHRRLGHHDWQEQEAFGAGSHGPGGATAGARAQGGAVFLNHCG